MLFFGWGEFTWPPGGTSSWTNVGNNMPIYYVRLFSSRIPVSHRFVGFFSANKTNSSAALRLPLVKKTNNKKKRKEKERTIFWNEMGYLQSQQSIPATVMTQSNNNSRGTLPRIRLRFYNRYRHTLTFLYTHTPTYEYGSSFFFIIYVIIAGVYCT